LKPVIAKAKTGEAFHYGLRLLRGKSGKIGFRLSRGSSATADEREGRPSYHRGRPGVKVFFRGHFRGSRLGFPPSGKGAAGVAFRKVPRFPRAVSRGVWRGEPTGFFRGFSPGCPPVDPGHSFRTFGPNLEAPPRAGIFQGENHKVFKETCQSKWSRTQSMPNYDIICYIIIIYTYLGLCPDLAANRRPARHRTRKPSDFRYLRPGQFYRGRTFFVKKSVSTPIAGEKPGFRRGSAGKVVFRPRFAGFRDGRTGGSAPLFRPRRERGGSRRGRRRAGGLQKA
jgi:hypothetical protein